MSIIVIIIIVVIVLLCDREESFDKLSHLMNCFPIPLRKSISESQEKKSFFIIKAAD